jgi:hypothetical protein
LTALLLGACSSGSENAKQPDDEFLDKVEAVCRDASGQIRKLTTGAADAPSDLRDIISDAADSLNELTPPSDLSKDWDKYTAKVDELVTKLGAVVDAIDAGGNGGTGDTGDTANTAEQTALADVNAATNEADLLVNTLGAIRCRGLVPVNALTPDDVPTAVTDTTPTVDTITAVTVTIPETDATDATVATSPPNTPLQIDSIPVTEAPPPSATTGAPTIFPSDLSLEATAPPGYEWVAFDPPEASGLFNNSVIGKLVVSYAAGEFASTTDPAATATVYVVTLSTPFTPDYVKAYQFWEAVDHGTDVATPGGRTVHQEIGAFPDIDCAVYTNVTSGLALCTFTGTDGLPLIDQFLDTNGF